MRVRLDDSRRTLASGLRGRREEIARAVAIRVHAIDDAPTRRADQEYMEGLSAAIDAAVEHMIEVVEGVERAVPVPTPILVQARLAAGRRVPLDTMLRRYLAGHSVLGDFVVEEAGRQATAPDALRWALRAQAARTDQILVSISAAYAEEAAAVRPLTSDRRKADQARRLLAGELADPSGLEYEFDRSHVGLVGRGPGGEQVIRAAAGRIDTRLLMIKPGEELVWAWLGRAERLNPDEVQTALCAGLPANAYLAIGEPGEGRAGWQLTHQQAKAALSVAIHGPKPIVRYADVALMAVAMQDELFTTSARRLYLEPLAVGRDGGRSLRETLRAFFAVQQNVSSAAAALGVTRQTVTNRLRMVERRLDRPLSSCASELQAVLCLQGEAADPQRTATTPSS